jgi:hypothetical protein
MENHSSPSLAVEYPRPGIDLVSCGGVCIFNPEPSGHQFHRDQQSEALLAHGSITTVLTHLLVATVIRCWCWEHHGKMPSLLALPSHPLTSSEMQNTHGLHEIGGSKDPRCMPAGANSDASADNRPCGCGTRLSLSDLGRSSETSGAVRLSKIGGGLFRKYGGGRC